MQPALKIADIASEMFFLHFRALNQFLKVLWNLDTQTILEFDPTNQISVSVTVNHSVCTTVRKNRIRFREMGTLIIFLTITRLISQHTLQLPSLWAAFHMTTVKYLQNLVFFLNKVKNFINTVLYM